MKLNSVSPVCRFGIGVFILFFTIISGYGQNGSSINVSPGIIKPELNAEKLELSWEVLKTKYPGQPQVMAALTLTNRGNVILPSKGWKIYFNYGRQISEVKGDMKFEFLNGDLNRMLPVPGFNGLPPGESIRIEYVANGKAVNFTDAPSGFYMVWDNNPDTGYSLKGPIIQPLSLPNSDGHITPQLIFNRNKGVKHIPDDELSQVFPTPVSYQKTAGLFTLSAKVFVIADTHFKREAEFLSKQLKEVFGFKSIAHSGTGPHGIMLRKIDGLQKEAYLLQVTAEHIIISASETAGIFYGIQSLISMLPPKAYLSESRVIKLPGLEISDFPRFGHRAFMMDVARNFQPKEQVFKVLDLMALYKLNILHFHLNDDEGWRLEIPALPELTEVGAKRAHTLNSKKNLPASYGSGADINNTFGTGYYTKSEFIEILKYATERHIRVIPEVETPGHARAAVRSMDVRFESLSKAGKKEEAGRFMLRDIYDKSVYRSVQRWDDNVMNVALPSTYNFIETVIDEICNMYKQAGAPLETIHLGGDEVPAGVWEKSPAVKELQKLHSEIKSTDDLWYYYFSRVDSILKSRDLYLSGWEEVALRKTTLDGRVFYIPNPAFVNHNFHAYVWNNVWGWGSEDLAYRLANAGYKTILAPVTNFYFDMAYQKDFDELGTYWATYTDIDAPFSFVPFDYYRTAKDNQGNPVKKSIFTGKERLTDFGKSNIVGVQCLLWSETVRSKEQFEYLLTPKILGFAERAWAKEPEWSTEKDSIKAKVLYNDAWGQFINIVSKRELVRLNTYGFKYRIPTAGAIIENGKVYANSQFQGLQIRYTSNGSEPGISSKLYKSSISEKGIIRLRVFDHTGRGGRTISIINN